MSTTTKIRTPNGKKVSPKRYLALAKARAASRAGASPCEHGHFDCAAWDGGPCFQEVESRIEAADPPDVAAERRSIRYSYLQATDSDGRMIFPRVETERVFLVTVYEGEMRLDDDGVAAVPEKVWFEHNNHGRPLGTAIRSMCVGDVLVLHDGPSESGLDDHSMVLVAADVGFVRAGGRLAEKARRMAIRGIPANDSIEGEAYFDVFRSHEAQAHAG